MQSSSFSEKSSGTGIYAPSPSSSIILSTISSGQFRRGKFAMKNGDGSINRLQYNVTQTGSRSRSFPMLSGYTSRFSVSKNLDIDLEKIYNAMEKGHKVCKLLLLKKWDPSYKKLYFNRDTRQIVLSKYDTTNNTRSCSTSKTTSTLDLRLVKDACSLHYKLNTIQIADKWKKDKEIQRFNPEMILIVSFGSSFVLNYWILLFESKDACHLWCNGLNYLRREIVEASHFLVVERWLRKQFYSIVNPETSTITIKHMKPFVQTKLQCKVQSKQLQEITEEEMGFEAFVFAHNRLLNFESIYTLKFADLGNEKHLVLLPQFLKFINEFQGDEIGKSNEACSNFLRKYLRDVDLSRDVPDPYLTAAEFIDYLFSVENSIFNPLNKEVVQDMTRPLQHYWIASSHNTYLTGDQLKSESSLDSYSRALLMGCRCIELDCWDGQRKSSGEFLEIVIYHGYTMTSKLNFRDVLYTIKHYAFLTNQYPLILSIEDNCSVPAQRQMAQDIKEILGDMLLTQPVCRDEWQLPSPEALKNKIILKHKKLQLDKNDSFLSHQSIDDDQDHDILSRECSKKGVLFLRDNTCHLWTKHIFLLFPDRLCYVLNSVEKIELSKDETQTDEESGIMTWQDSMEDSSLLAFGVRPEEMHVTEEWFHGKVGRDVAKDRLMEQDSKGNGVFLVRESGTFIGDYTLSFLYDHGVNHCRIKTAMVGGSIKYYFFEPLKRDTLYELISYYTKHSIDASSFKAYLSIPCPQPQPHLNEPWFCGEADKQRAEELLSTVREDGAFLIRYSSSDQNVFVLSLRVDGEFWHYRLKRDGRIFVVNQMVFENLNQIVDFYSDRDFVRGICLKYPVNEKNVGQYANLSVTATGCYMELKDLNKKDVALSIKQFVGTSTDHLSFPANVHISIIQKDPDLWKGRYNDRVGWFPPSHVNIISTNGDGNIDSSLNYETIELAGSTFEIYESDRAHSFRIFQSSTFWNVQEYIVAAESREELDEWLNTMDALVKTVNNKINLLRTKEKQLKIASELSSLVVYCQAVPFNVDFLSQDPRLNFFEMCSFSESKHDKLIEKGLVVFNSRQLSRVYPQASRLTSTNFNPVPMWNSGCHMVALNYQTGDRAMQLNNGKFSANGRCGYVLKPQYLMDENFRVDQSYNSASTFFKSTNSLCLQPEKTNEALFSSSNLANGKNIFPICLKLQIIAGKHLSRKDNNKGICSPFVEVELAGLSCDSVVYRTNTITSNGLNPTWHETFVFNIFRPEMALLRFFVEDGDFVGPKADPFIGQAVFPVECIRDGYRSIPLLNQFNEPLELSALLVHVELRTASDSPILNLHAFFQSGRLANIKDFQSQIGSSAEFSSYSGINSPLSQAVRLTDTFVERKNLSSGVESSGDSFVPLSQLSLSSNMPTASVDFNENIFSTTTQTAPKKSSKALRRIFKFTKL